MNALTSLRLEAQSQKVSSGRLLLACTLLASALALPGATFTWDGGGRGGNWSSAANWDQINDLPDADDHLVFSSSAQLVTTNDLGSYWFRSIDFTSPGYEVWGTTRFTNGVTISHGLGTTRIRTGLYLQFGQTVSVPQSRAQVRFDEFLSVPVNGAPDEIVVGTPPPLRVAVLDHIGRIELANLFGKGGRIEKYGSGPLIIERTGSKWIFLKIREGSVSVRGPAEWGGTTTHGVGLLATLYDGALLSGWGELWEISSENGGRVVPGGFGLPLTVNDSVWLGHSNAVLQITLSGSPPSVAHHQLAVKSVVSLSSAKGHCQLDIGLGRVGLFPIIGQGYRIIDNQGNGPVYGTFAGLAQNAVTNVSGIDFQIDYGGGDGNDVYLKVVGVSPTGHAKTWTGHGADNHWTTPENWVDDKLPWPGDDLIFPASGLQRTNMNSFASDVSFNSITFTGPNYHLSGSGIRLTGGVHARNTTGANTFNIGLRLEDHQIFTNDSHALGTTLKLISLIIPNNHELLFQNDLGDTYVSAAILGKGQIGKGGPGELIFDHPNSYTAFTRIFQGRLTLNPNGGLGVGGTVASSTIIYPGGTLALVGAHVLDEFITLYGTNGTGALLVAGAPSLISGEITLFQDGRITVSNGGKLTLSGAVSGEGGLWKSGPGTLNLSGASDNTYEGVTSVEHGRLELEKSTGAHAVPEALFVGDGSGAPTTAQVHLLANHQIHSMSDVQIHSDGRLWLAAFVQDNIGSLSGVGPIDSANGTSLAVGLNHASTEYNGTITGDLLLKKLGQGVFTLAGVSSHTGSYVGGGTLALPGTHGGTVTAANGGTVIGPGTIIGDLNLTGGSLDPGPGGVLNVQGNFSATASSQVHFDLAGTTAGVGYDQLDVSGSVTLGNAQLILDLDPNFTPPEGAQFTILNKAGLGAVSGTFGGVNNGDIVSAGGSTFQVYYTSGTGNDVVLTQIPSAQMAMLSMDDTGTAVFAGDYLPGRVILLEMTRELGERARWRVIDEVTVDTKGRYEVADHSAKKDPMRFYRLRFD